MCIMKVKIKIQRENKDWESGNLAYRELQEHLKRSKGKKRREERVMGLHFARKKKCSTKAMQLGDMSKNILANLVFQPRQQRQDGRSHLHKQYEKRFSKCVNNKKEFHSAAHTQRSTAVLVAPTHQQGLRFKGRRECQLRCK